MSAYDDYLASLSLWQRIRHWIHRYVIETGSSDSVFLGFSIFGNRHRKSWWFQWFVMPPWRLCKRISNARWWLTYRFVKRHRYHLIDTKLEPGCYDHDYRLLHGCFAVLGEYIEHMGGMDVMAERIAELRDHPDPNAPDGLCESCASHEEKARDLWHWWKVLRPDRHKRASEMMMSLFGRQADEMFSKPDPVTGLSQYQSPRWNEEEEKRYEEYRALEKQNEEDDQTMLHRLIDIREGLWT